MTLAIFPGSFDPITLGHLDVAKRALSVFDQLVILVGYNDAKSGMFRPEQRVELIAESLAAAGIGDGMNRVTCEATNGLVVDFALRVGANAIVRAARTAAEFEAEATMGMINRQMSGVETVVFTAAPELSYVSSSRIKEIAKFGRDLTGLAPEPVAKAVAAALAGAAERLM